MDHHRRGGLRGRRIVPVAGGRRCRRARAAPGHVPFLYGDADRAAAAPEAHEIVGTKARCADVCSQLKRVGEQIVGAGGHGLATAYYLGKNFGIKNVAILEKGWLGGGNTGRNTTIIRSNYLQDPSAAIYEKARSLYETMSQDLNYNVMFSPRGWRSNRATPRMASRSLIASVTALCEIDKDCEAPLTDPCWAAATKYRICFRVKDIAPFMTIAAWIASRKPCRSDLFHA